MIGCQSTNTARTENNELKCDVLSKASDSDNIYPVRAKFKEAVDIFDAEHYETRDSSIILKYAVVLNSTTEIYKEYFAEMNYFAKEICTPGMSLKNAYLHSMRNADWLLDEAIEKWNQEKESDTY